MVGDGSGVVVHFWRLWALGWVHLYEIPVLICLGRRSVVFEEM
jgi:hypothetical protein